jgi:hypothetical protein
MARVLSCWESLSPYLVELDEPATEARVHINQGTRAGPFLDIIDVS